MQGQQPGLMPGTMQLGQRQVSNSAALPWVTCDSNFCSQLKLIRNCFIVKLRYTWEALEAWW